MRAIRTLAISMALVACNGDTDTDETSDTSSDSEMTSDSEEMGGFTVSGNLLSFPENTAAADVCVQLVDPTDALLGTGDLIVLGTTTADASGAYEITDVVTDAAYGIFVLADDCAAEAAFWGTATAIPTDAYADAGEGDVVTGNGIVMSAAGLAAYQADLTTVGYAGTVETEGAALVLVGVESGPIDGGVVTCGACTPYYMSAITGGDVFGTTGSANTATAAAAQGMVMIPGAPAGAFDVTATGYTFPTTLFGSLPGILAVGELVGTTDP